jgi:hypothetical protein
MGIAGHRKFKLGEISFSVKLISSSLVERVLAGRPCRNNATQINADLMV